MKICSVVGARPQFIKAGAVSRALARHGDVREVLIHTGQHYDPSMSDVFFEELGLAEPAYNLGVGSGAHGAQTARMLERLEQVLLREAPRAAIVYGDTNSTLAGAVAATKLHVPVGHVEAGLRSFNRRMPEEINRIVADAVADVLFAPTLAAMEQLQREGHPTERIVLSGDVMYDVALMTADAAREHSTILETLGLVDRGYYLATVHRAESTDVAVRLRAIMEALSIVAAAIPVVLPLHPRTRAALQRESLADELPASLRVIEPVGYVDMARLEMGARAIATDSGGVQKEAFFHRVPCFTIRNETEWVELVAMGWNVLVPPGDPASMARTMLDVAGLRPKDGSPYGDGHAAEIIADELLARYEP